MLKVFDGHCDTIMRVVEQPGAHISGTGGQWDMNRLTGTMQVAQLFAFFWDSAEVTEAPAEMLERYYNAFRKEMALHSDRIVQCRNGAEVTAALATGRHAAILSVEGGDLLGCDVALLHRAYEMGVRAVNLTWNHANLLSGSNVEEPDRGLSMVGMVFVREMERLGMVPDVSHLSEAGFWNVLEIAQRPILASHSNSKTVHDHPRNLTDDQFRGIIKNQGIVGLNGFTDFIGESPVTQVDLMRHLEHFLSLGGEKTVALGGDWDGCDRLPEDWAGVWNWLDFYELLLKENYSEALLQDLFFNNFMRLVDQL